MNNQLALLFAAFIFMTFWTVFKKAPKGPPRNRIEWFLDTTSLLQQGVLFPFFQTVVLFNLFSYFFPTAKGTVHLSPFTSFLIQFIVLDYVYYWNHRLLHTKSLWPLHRIHHSSQKLDLWVTSRNSFWSSFFILYLWIHSLFIFLLDDSTSFLWAIAIGNILDLWRHSGLRIPQKAESLIGRIFITPKDHGWHHSSTTHGKNFGANFSIWDKWHSTYYQSSTVCDLLGEKINDPFAIQWLQPWKIKSGGFDS